MKRRSRFSSARPDVEVYGCLWPAQAEAVLCVDLIRNGWWQSGGGTARREREKGLQLNLASLFFLLTLSSIHLSLLSCFPFQFLHSPVRGYSSVSFKMSAEAAPFDFEKFDQMVGAQAGIQQSTR